MTIPFPLAARMESLTGSEIRERMKHLGERSLIHLGGGLPDPALFPIDRIAAAASAVLSDPARARQALQYAPSEGHGPLREWLAGYMTKRGAPCLPANILVTTGSQQALDLVAKLLLAPGDTVMVELPSFIGALRAFDVQQVRYVGWPEEGALPHSALRLGYAGPDFRNPTGTCLSLAQRRRMLDIATIANIPILEDGCYEALRYDGEDLPSLLALDIARTGGIGDSLVLYAGTFSKTLAPGLRVGWIAAAEPLIRKLTLLKQAADLSAGSLDQMIALALMRDPEPLLASLRTAYRERRDAMLAALAEHMPEEVSWTKPEGGLYIWLTLPEALDGGAFAERALSEQGVTTISGGAFYPLEAQRNTLRLSFSLASIDEAREGVRRLGALAREMIR
jgi:DNA-binding transcriptional MocR family regulator